MKQCISLILSAGIFLAIPSLVFPDAPQTTAISGQLYEMDLLIKAMEAADAIPASRKEESNLAKQKYRVRDYLDELMVTAYERMAEMLSETPSEKWAQHLTKRQWIERLIRHFLSHHAGSGNERWAIMCQVYMSDKKVTSDLFRQLMPEQQRRLIADLKSPLNNYEPEACSKFADELTKLR